jgi:hypothetical protein
MLTRRRLLTTVSLTVSTALLAACATKTSPVTNLTTTVIDPQILANAQAAVSESAVISSLVEQHASSKLKPADVAKLTTAQAAAAALLSGLSAATFAAPAATTLQKIDAAINTVLDVAGPVLTIVAAADPALAPAVTAYDLIIPLLPAIEAWVNSIILGSTKAAAAPRQPIRTAYTAAQSRGIIAGLRLSEQH